MICLPFIVVLLSSRIISADNVDKECEESFLCSPSESCDFYQQLITEIQKARKAETKREIFTKLRSSINNDYHCINLD